MNAHVAVLSASGQDLGTDGVIAQPAWRERIRVRFYAAMMIGDALIPLLLLAVVAKLLSPDKVG